MVIWLPNQHSTKLYRFTPWSMLRYLLHHDVLLNQSVSKNQVKLPRVIPTIFAFEITCHRCGIRLQLLHDLVMCYLETIMVRVTSASLFLLHTVLSNFPSTYIFILFLPLLGCIKKGLILYHLFSANSELCCKITRPPKFSIAPYPSPIFCARYGLTQTVVSEQSFHLPLNNNEIFPLAAFSVGSSLCSVLQ